MYIAASLRKPGDKARLLMPQIPKTNAKCLRFWYHMYGGSVGSLTVYKKTGSSVGARVWTLSGNQGNEWLVAQITIYSPRRPFRVSFEGTVGKGKTGDIAIDDVEIFNGQCARPGMCC